MNRRQFVKRLTALAAIAAISPSVVPATKSQLPTEILSYPTGKLKMSAIVEGYYELSYGREHPTLILMSRMDYADLLAMIDPSQRRFSESRMRDGLMAVRFEDADVAPCAMRKGVANFINERFPTDVRYSREVRLYEAG